MIIPILSIINRFNIFDVNRLLVASITPCVSLEFLPWCFCASIKVISSGMLVTKPKTIPIIASGISNTRLSFSSVPPNKFPNYE